MIADDLLHHWSCPNGHGGLSGDRLHHMSPKMMTRGGLCRECKRPITIKCPIGCDGIAALSDEFLDARHSADDNGQGSELLVQVEAAMGGEK